eukprot:864943-Prorocentrum_lima.AAC.1
MAALRVDMLLLFVLGWTMSILSVRIMQHVIAGSFIFNADLRWEAVRHLLPASKEGGGGRGFRKEGLRITTTTNNNKQQH